MLGSSESALRLEAANALFGLADKSTWKEIAETFTVAVDDEQDPGMREDLAALAAGIISNFSPDLEM